MKTTCKKLLITWGLLLFLLSFLPIASADPAALGISARGQKAIEQISTCINSEGKDTLNVLYLVDESYSLTWTDPKGLRVGGIQASLEQFRNVSVDRPHFTVNRSIMTFGDSVKPQKKWDVLTQSQLNDDLDWIKNNVPSLTEGQATDWRLALNSAYSEFEKKFSNSSCHVMVWFTDGAINVGAQTQEAMQQICGVDPVSGRGSGSSIINKFRNSGINIQGVLLKNAEYFSNPEKYNKKRKDAELDSQGMTFFSPILEYSGEVDKRAFGGTGTHDLNCGSDTGAAGVVQTIGDPLDIIWFPVPFNCLATNGRILPVDKKTGKVIIDKGMTRFQVTTPKQGFTLTNSEGDQIAAGESAGKAQVQIRKLGQSDSIISVSGEITDTGVTAPGVWSFNTSQPDRAVFCGYLDLQVEIKGKTCYENESCDFNGRISRIDGRPVDFTIFPSTPKLSYSALKPDGGESGRNSLMLNTTDGSYSGAYSTNGLVDSAGLSKLKVNLNVTTKSGYEFSISNIKDFAVVPPGRYPEVTPNPISKANFKQAMVGKKGEALADLVLTGPSRTSGEICFSALQVRTDPLPKRIPDYTSSLDGKDLAGSQCFTLKAGEKRPVQLSIKNNQSAKGTVSGFINVTLKSDGQRDISSKVNVDFETDEKIDRDRFLLTFFLIMLLGFGIPLALFYLVNALGARIQLSTLSMASVPMILSASGGFVNMKRKEPGKTSGILNYDDFDGFKHTTEKVKQVNIGSENLKGRAPKNPFGRIRAILTTAPGYVVVSSELSTHAGKGLLRNQTDAALNPSGKMHLALSESGLSALKKQNQGIETAGQLIEANLITVMGFTSMDPNQEIESLNMSLASQTGWLDKLLKLPEPVALAPAKQKKVKKSKGDDGTSGNVGGGAPVEPDDWGSPSTSAPKASPGTPAAAKPASSGDDWGSASPGKDDWGTPSGNTDWGSSSGGKSTSNDGW
jgi:hypothetical protein